MTKKIEKIWRENCAVKAKALTAEEFVKIPRIYSVGFLFLAAFLIFMTIVLLKPSLIFAADEQGSVMVTTQTSEAPFGERKNMKGSVGSLNKQGMALVYKTDEATHAENEMWLPFDPGVRLSGYSALTDIQENDQVVVNYEEDSAKTKRIMREINFVSRPEPAPVVPETPETPQNEAAQ